MFIFCATSTNVSPDVATAIDRLSACEGFDLQQMLSKVAQRLRKAAVNEDEMDVEGSIEGVDSEPDQSEAESDEQQWEPDSPRAGNIETRPKGKCQDMDPKAQERIRQDLRYVKSAGFRLSYLTNPLDGGNNTVLMVSIRVAKLGISEEALQAWHLDPSQYFMLLIRYTSGYRTLEQILQDCSFSGANESLMLRVGLAVNYKLQAADAVAAFNDSKAPDKDDFMGNEDPQALEDSEDQEQRTKALAPLFISKPLNDLLGKRLTTILRNRLNYGLKWKGAEDFYNDHQGMNFSENDAVDQQYYKDDRSNIAHALPQLVTADHMQSASFGFSFPLLAMQFSLRHLVRCTEFCLVCHCHIEADFEALKPYVCGKPLCLFQYMAYGFGPSIEHEILTQPFVVDLLISFCYASACRSRLKDLPYGMGLMVPFPTYVNESGVTNLANYRTGPIDIDGAGKTANNGSIKPSDEEPAKYQARYDVIKQQLVATPDAPDIFKSQYLRPGTWLFIDNADRDSVGVDRINFHCKVESVGYQTVQLGPAVQRAQTEAQTGEQSYSSNHVSSYPKRPSFQQPPEVATPPYHSSVAISGMPLVNVSIYEQHFDDLTQNLQFRAIKVLLDTLPSIEEMQTYLIRKRGNTSLASYSERISPAALGLLRWIIASNRSCIVQVDDINGDRQKAEERVSGMPGYMQFRFAQGAPDKEQRFITAVKQETNADNKDFPSIFAWHGSPVYNWHGIVREGLHFNETINGRAFGNGVYHATDVTTSIGYSGMYGRARYGGGEAGFGGWPQSSLKIEQAVALNEIVNRPDKYVSTNPHLVVAQLDWIQSRYLFVKCTGVDLPDENPTNIIGQDPKYTPRGSSGLPVRVPITAVSKSRRPGTKAVSKGFSFGLKKSKVSEKYPAVNADNLVYISEDTDDEDLTVFQIISERPQETATAGQSESKEKGTAGVVVKGARPNPDPTMTDFRPGTLNVETLPLIAPPSYATPCASRSLQKELQSTLNVQESHPLHELGWYINPEIISNMYQWVFELHSFDRSIPLSRDLKDRGLISVVAEIRFGKDYPMSPPFVRIIRPRFLSFMQGGGGHVTAGGALCLDLLTNSGWSVANSVESVLLQVRMAICSTDPKPARLEGRKGDAVRDYGAGEAVEAYVRACRTHGWEVPKEFEQNFRPQSSDFSSAV